MEETLVEEVVEEEKQDEAKKEYLFNPQLYLLVSAELDDILGKNFSAELSWLFKEFIPKTEEEGRLMGLLAQAVQGMIILAGRHVELKKRVSASLLLEATARAEEMKKKNKIILDP